MPNLVIPNSFTPLTDILSSPMNENFTAIANAVINSLARDGSDAMTAALQLANGSAASPALTFATDTDLGLYRKTANQLGFASAGVERFYVDDSGKLWILGAVDIAGALTIAQIDFSSVSAEADPAAADTMLVYDDDAGAGRQMTLPNLLKVINALSAETSPATDDELALYDTDGSATDKITLANLLKVINALTEDPSPDVTADFVLTYDNSASAAKKAKIQSIASGQLVAIIEDQKSSGTDGGSASSGSDQTRDLNTLVFNRNTIVGLSSNQFTLPAGDWEIEWSAPVFRLLSHQSLLRDTTAGSDVKRGSTELAPSAGDSHDVGRSIGSARVSIAGSTTYEIRHRVGQSRATNGWGVAGGFGTEVYTRVVIRRG